MPSQHPRQEPWHGTSLAEEDWQGLARAHASRLRSLLGDALARRKRGQKDPIVDFLFDYYALRPGRLMRWTPGPAVELQGESAKPYLRLPGFVGTDRGVLCDPAAFPAQRLGSVRWIRDVLLATASRQPFTGCYCLHEWAMVYRTDDIRHRQLPLRLSPEALAEFVESMPIACSHWDAFRFFSPAARPRNRLQPSPDRMAELEQPGCLHANMDVYRWALKLYPWLPGELLADAFVVAWAARRVDMRASPYDVSCAGLEPIPVETAEGRRAFQQAQRDVAAAAAPVRQRVIAVCEALLASAPAGPMFSESASSSR